MLLHKLFCYGNHTPLQCGNSKRIESGLIIATVPTILRLMQVFRMANDKKIIKFPSIFCQPDLFKFCRYMCSLLTAVFSYLSLFYPDLFSTWAIFAFINAAGAYYWDVTRAWGFFQKDTHYSIH